MTITKFFNMWIDCLFLGDFPTILTTILIMCLVLIIVYLIIIMIKYKDSAILSHIAAVFMELIFSLCIFYLVKTGA